MKFALMLGVTLLGVLIGYLPHPSRTRPIWWRTLAILGVVLTIVLGLMPPIAGTITDVVMVARMDSTKVTPALMTTQLRPGDVPASVLMTDARDERVIINVTLPNSISHDVVPTTAPFVVNLQRGSDDRHFTAVSLGTVDPVITLPYIMGLEERARIIFFHVPMSWVATIAYLIGMIYAVMFLRKRDLQYDTMSMAAASVATLYAILATVTGSIWAKFNWGSFWNWDPREASIFLLLMVYAAYFLLRGSIDDPERRARLSAVYSIVAFVTVPFLVFVLPRLVPGLHPGSADDVNAGPLLSPKSDAISTTKQIVFNLSLFAFTLVFMWLMGLKVRLTNLINRREAEEMSA